MAAERAEVGACVGGFQGPLRVRAGHLLVRAVVCSHHPAGSASACARATQQDGAAKRPSSAYIHFCNEKRTAVTASFAGKEGLALACEPAAVHAPVATGGRCSVVAPRAPGAPPDRPPHALRSVPARPPQDGRGPWRSCLRWGKCGRTCLPPPRSHTRRLRRKKRPPTLRNTPRALRPGCVRMASALRSRPSTRSHAFAVQWQSHAGIPAISPTCVQRAD